ncbi:MAG TPA: LysR substrate-binding domain-containing protein [Acidimicrobiales bacterium]
MDLRQVEYVVAVVDHGGFTRAAAALHVAQPSLSQGVRRLEAELGAPLFVRVGRSVRLSEAGQAFIGPARQLLRAARTARDTVRAHAELTSGTLDLVALPTLVADPLAPLIAAFRERHPSVAVRVIEPADPADLLAQVWDGRCDVGLTEAGSSRHGITSHPIADQELLAVLPPGSDVSDDRITVAELVSYPLVLGPSGTSARENLERALGRAGLVLDAAVETAQREAMVPLVLRGAGATVLPAPLAADAAERGAVVRGLTPPLTRSLVVVHRSDDLSPAARAFLRVAGVRVARTRAAQLS